MNLHLMFDEKFLDAFIKDAELVAPGQNKYLFTFKPPAKLIKYPGGIFAPYGSKVFIEELNTLKGTDRLYIHWFNDYLLDFIKMLPATTKVYLFFWGGDLIEQTLKFYNYNFEPKTKRFLDSDQRKKIQYIPRNPITYSKKLTSYLKYRISKYNELKKKEHIRKQFLKRLNFFCHWNSFDFDDVINAYGGNAQHLNFFYEAGINAITQIEIPNNDPQREVTIWLGNSASATNNHLDALSTLRKFATKNIKIVSPLNYGNLGYGKFIHKAAENIFQNKWLSLIDFLPLEEYLRLLKSADIVLMYHNRTQAAGNTFCLIKMGKKVYLKKKSSIYKLLKSNGVIVFEAENIENESYESFCKPLTQQEAEKNFAIISALFSDEKRINYLTNILN